MSPKLGGLSGRTTSGGTFFAAFLGRIRIHFFSRKTDPDPGNLNLDPQPKETRHIVFPYPES